MIALYLEGLIAIAVSLWALISPEYPLHYPRESATLPAPVLMFFLATAGLFGYADGSEWGLSHFRMKPAG